MDQIKFKLKTDNIKEFKSVMSDLSKISALVKLKIEDTNLLLYTADTAGDGANATVLAFKTHTFPIDHFFDIKTDTNESSIDEFTGEENKQEIMKIDWIIPNVKTVNKKLSFLSEKIDIKGSMKIRKTNNDQPDYTRMVSLSDGKFKFSISGGESHLMRDVSMDQLNKLLDPSNSEMNFSFSTKEFLLGRSASDIESGEDNKMVNIEIKNNGVYLSQSNWEMLVGKKEGEDQKRKFSFNKKYLKSINPSVEEVHFYVFPSFLLYQEGNQKLMISFEQSF